MVALLTRAAEHIKSTGGFCFDKAKDALGDRHGDRALAALAGGLARTSTTKGTADNRQKN